MNSFEDFKQEPSHETERLPEGWRECIHPRGWIYFHNSKLQIVTDQDMRIPRIRDLILDHHLDNRPPGTEVQCNIQTRLDVPRSMDNVAYLPSRQNSLMAVDSLFINHNDCVASHNPLEVAAERIQGMDPNTLNRRRRMYWNFLWTHPAHADCPSRALPDAADALTWYHTDNLISGSKSTVPFSRPECEDLLKQIERLSAPHYEKSISKTVFLSWLLREISSFRDAESWGKHVLKQDRELRDDSAHHINYYAHLYKPEAVLLPVVNVMINLFYFGIPWTYLAHTKSAFEFRGRLSDMESHWKKFIARLVDECSHFLLISTVLLSATVGMLTIENIEREAQVASTISAYFALGSIIVGVFSVWRHQAYAKTSDAFTYMRNARKGYFGLHGHAIMLSLPPVFLVWATVTFSVAIVLYTVQNIAIPSGTMVEKAWAGVCLGTFGVILGLVLLALYTFAVMWDVERKEPSIFKFMRLAKTPPGSVA